MTTHEFIEKYDLNLDSLNNDRNVLPGLLEKEGIIYLDLHYFYYIFFDDRICFVMGKLPRYWTYETLDAIEKQKKYWKKRKQQIEEEIIKIGAANERFKIFSLCKEQIIKYVSVTEFCKEKGIK